MFRKNGSYWSISFAGRDLRVEARKGPEYIARLLARPGEELHVCDLQAETARDPQSSERVRKAVTNRIREAIEKIAKEHHELAAHLRGAIRTGRRCSYFPGRTIDWDV